MKDVDTVQLMEDTGSDVNLSELQTLVQTLSKLESDIESKESELKALKESMMKLETVLIPEKMGNVTELRVDVFGRKKIVKIKKIVRANIKKENRDQAFEWLDTTGHGDLIKSEVVMAYPRQKLDEAKQVLIKLRDQGLNPEFHQEVHWQTLDAWAREQLDAGMEFPPFIGVFEAKKAEVKDGK